MIYIFGDVHFTSAKPWLFRAGEIFLKEFEKLSQEISKQDNDSNIIWLGDMTDKFSLTGDVAGQLIELMNLSCKYYNNVVVVTGNHDVSLLGSNSLNKLVMLHKISNKIKLVEDIEELTLSNTKIRAMPFKRCLNLEEEYSNMNFKDEVDLTVGHWSLYSKGSFIQGVKTDNLNTKDIVLGHIHNRPQKEYCGSVFALNRAEEHTPVCKVYDNGNFIKDIKLPIIINYHTIKYESKIDDIYNKDNEENGLNVFYVEGNVNINSCRAYYKDFYIANVISPIAMEEIADDNKVDITNISPKEMFLEWSKVGKNTYSTSCLRLASSFFN